MVKGESRFARGISASIVDTSDAVLSHLLLRLGGCGVKSLYHCTSRAISKQKPTLFGVYTPKKERATISIVHYSSNEILCLKPRASGVIFHGTEIRIFQLTNYGEDVGLVDMDPFASGGIGLCNRIPEYTKITGPTAGREKTG